MIRKSCFAAASALTLAACAVGPDYRTPDISPLAPQSFEDAAAGESVRADWWSVFNDPQLTDLIGAAFAENRDLKTAEANVRASRAVLGERRFDLAPTVTASGAYRRSRTSAAALGATVPGAGGDQPFDDANLFDAGADAAWEIDFWGRVRRSVEAARAEASAAEADYRNALVLVGADVATAYVSLRGAQRQLAVAERNGENQRESLELTQTLLDGGRATELDVARARGQYETTLSTIPPLRAAVAAQIRRLGVLTGKSPDALTAELVEVRALPQFPEGAPAGDPALLLRLRPDIAAAERRLAAATARIGVAAGELFPTVSFNGSFGASAATLASFGTAPSVDYAFGPSIRWAFLDLGRVRARLRQASAASEAALAQYEQTVLLALEETQNAFTRYARERERAARLEAVVQSNTQAAEIARLRYEAGLDTFLVVLDAQRQLLLAEDQSAQSDAEALRQLIGVYRALGGGWRAASNGSQ